MNAITKHPVSERYLWLGVVLGGSGFLISLLWDGFVISQRDPAQAVASVNHIEIDKSNYLNQLESLAEGKRNPLQDDDADRVLSRIIEEELLVQRGLEVQLPKTDRQTRAAIVSAMIGMVTAEANSYQPTTAELTDFYRDNQDYFRKTARLRLKKLDFSSADALQQAQLAREKLLKGQGLETMESGTAKLDRYLPDTLLPPKKLAEYIGPSMAREMTRASVGDVRIRDRQPQGVSLYYLAEKKQGGVRPFTEVKTSVETEFVRRKADTALREYVDWLRKRAEITVFSQARVTNKEG